MRYSLESSKLAKSISTHGCPSRCDFIANLHKAKSIILALTFLCFPGKLSFFSPHFRSLTCDGKHVKCLKAPPLV